MLKYFIKQFRIDWIIPVNILVVLIILSGCSSTPLGECIPIVDMPYKLHENGVTYLLIDHVSIRQLMQANILQHQHQLSDDLREKFPTNVDLISFLNEVDKRQARIYIADDNLLRSIEQQLKKSRGELYEYRKLNEKDGGTEEGWLILSEGKVYTNILTATVLRGKDY